MDTTGAEVTLGASVHRAPGKLHGPEVVLYTGPGRHCAPGRLHGARVVLGEARSAGFWSWPCLALEDEALSRWGA
ncbi:hypothetical protein D7W79_03585 [Corallococcus exercitus]|nr:hypothetical protein D7W79_03585 [Corallococcus exercitus]